MENLLILGAGQYGALVYEIASECGKYEKIDFLDDNSEKSIGKISEHKDFLKKYKNAVVAIGNPDIRMKFLKMLKDAGFEIPVIISPRAWVSPSAVIGEGSVIEPNATVSTGVEIGRGCFVCAGAVVNHNAIMNDGSQANCNATICARAVVPENYKVDCGEVFQ